MTISRAAEPRHDGAHLRRGHGGGAATEQAQGGEVEPVEVGHRQQRRVHRGDGVEVRHALARDRLQDGARLGLRENDRGRPGVPRAERQRPTAHVEHGKHAEQHVVLVNPELEVRRRRLQPVAAVREQGSLRGARRPARVQHHVRIALVEVGRDVVGRLGVGQGGEVVERDEPAHRWKPASRAKRGDEGARSRPTRRRSPPPRAPRSRPPRRR